MDKIKIKIFHTALKSNLLFMLFLHITEVNYLILTILYFTNWFQIFKHLISFPIKPLNFTFIYFIIRLSSPKASFLKIYPILQIWIDWSNQISFCEEFVHFYYLFVVSQFILTKSHFEGFFVTFYFFSLRMRN